MSEQTHGYFIIGTAGHVDHGKTELIKRLTGIDTDRLPEEKKRGMSIDIGFAYFDLPDGKRVGIVDVPWARTVRAQHACGRCRHRHGADGGRS
jgi:selenocysteine-specific translation elongation factor